jgi:hypothetical protein
MKIIPISRTTPKPTAPIKLKVMLEDTPIEIYRKILVPENINMMQLHFVIQIAMGWQMAHLFQFSDKKVNYKYLVALPDDEIINWPGKLVGSLPEKTSLEKEFGLIRNSRPFYYTYDFGDNWTHKITFLKTAVADLEVFSGVPLLVEASGACPPEDVGGPWGYENFLEALNDKKHPEHKDFVEWVGLKRGQKYDEEFVDLDGINEELIALPASHYWRMTSKKFLR